MSNDLIVTNAKIFSSGQVLNNADAIAIKSGRIEYIGNEHDARAAVPGAAVVDAAGGLVTSAFFDSHIHPLQGGYERLVCDLTDSTSAESALEMVSAYVAQHPDDEWITGGGWHLDHFPGGKPLASELERIAPGKKIYLVNADHHGAWVSPAALSAAGISAETPNPPNGVIDRLPSGDPSGTLQESGMDLVEPFLPKLTVEQQISGLAEGQRFVHSLGIAGWQDAIVGSYAGFGDATKAYTTAFDRSDLKLRITGALWLRRDIAMDQIDDAVAGYIAQRSEFGNRVRPDGAGTLEANTIKIMMDGVPESLTAAMKSPYLNPDGTPMDTCGEGHFSMEFLESIVPKLALAGFQLHFHAIGDQAIADAITALEAAKAAGDDNHARHHIAHLQQMDLSDIPRMHAVGATANMQALWAAQSDQMLELNLPIVGAKRFGEQYPFKALQDAGIPLAMGSDWPVSTPDPWQAIHVAVNRTEPGMDTQQPLNPQFALDLATCITAYTKGSAQLQHHDDSGDLIVGNVADIAIADRNPFAHHKSEIYKVVNVATIVAGDLVYARND